MLQATHLIGFGVKRASTSLTCTDLGNISGTGTNIGDMTEGGGLAGAFDFNTSQATSASARKTSVTSSSVGKSWGGNKNICRFDLYGPTDDFFFGNSVAGNTIKLQGSATGSFSGEQTTLYTHTFGSYSTSQVISVTSGITGGNYAYHRWLFESAASTGRTVAEIRVWALA